MQCNHNGRSRRNQAYSRLSTTHGHITDCKLVCMYWTRLVLVVGGTFRSLIMWLIMGAPHVGLAYVRIDAICLSKMVRAKLTLLLPYFISACLHILVARLALATLSSIGTLGRNLELILTPR